MCSRYGSLSASLAGVLLLCIFCHSALAASWSSRLEGPVDFGEEGLEGNSGLNEFEEDESESRMEWDEEHADRQFSNLNPRPKSVLNADDASDPVGDSMLADLYRIN
jgi:hypothetical protein